MFQFECSTYNQNLECGAYLGSQFVFHWLSAAGINNLVDLHQQQLMRMPLGKSQRIPRGDGGWKCCFLIFDLVIKGEETTKQVSLNYPFLEGSDN